MKNHLELDDDFYWLLGWFLAEGNIRFSEKRMRGIEFTVALDEEEIANNICVILEKYFHKKVSYIKRYRKTGNAISVIFNSQIAGYLFESLCGKYSWAKNPRIPGSKRQLLITAIELLNGDGSVEKNRKRLITTSYKMSLWFRDIMISSGYRVSYRKSVRKNRRDTYLVSILDSCKISNPIRRIVSLGKEFFKGTVFNLLVEEHNEYYTVMGLVHNCGWNPQIDLEDIKLKIVQNEGKSMYDYDLWPDRLRAIARRPIVTETAEVLKEPTPSPDELRSRINSVLTGHKIRPSSVIVEPSARSGIDMRIEMKEDRSKVNHKMIKDRLLDG